MRKFENVSCHVLPRIRTILSQLQEEILHSLAALFVFLTRVMRGSLNRLQKGHQDPGYVRACVHVIVICKYTSCSFPPHVCSHFRAHTIWAQAQGGCKIYRLLSWNAPQEVRPALYFLRFLYVGSIERERERDKEREINLDRIFTQWCELQRIWIISRCSRYGTFNMEIKSMIVS